MEAINVYIIYHVYIILYKAINHDIAYMYSYSKGNRHIAFFAGPYWDSEQGKYSRVQISRTIT